MSYREPAKIFAIAGKDENTGDIIIKMVNANATPSATTIQWDNAVKIDSTATIITLSAEKETSENSFENPCAFTPVQHATAATSLILPPFSVNVLRLKTLSH